MATEQRRASRLRSLLPWVIGTAIIVVIASQVPFAQFRDSFGSGPHLELALVELICTFIALGTDAVSTWISMRVLNINWPLREVAAVRGASYLLVLVNYAVGQGSFGYYLYRRGVPAKRAVGASLFLMGTTLATLLTMAFAIWLIAGGSSLHGEMWWSIVVSMIAFAVYLGVIALRLGFIARREIFTPLFDAGIKGHAIAIASRLPHIFVIVATYWVAMRVWGIDIPFGIAMTLMPAVVLAAVLPISPAGLGTSQAAMVFFFAQYSSGATADARTADLLALGVAQFVYAALATILAGVVCLPFARRTGLLAREGQAQEQQA